MLARSFAVLVSLVAIGALAVAPGCSGEDFQPVDSDPDAAAGNGGSGGSGGSSGSAGGGAGGTAGSGASTGTDPNGTTCTDGGTCQSGNCADGVCCDTACDSDCETCVADGNEGTCTPHPDGEDPEGDCAGAGGAAAVCAGTCNGQSACDYPGDAVSCGDSTCTADVQTDAVCAGDGTCGSKQTPCGDYICGSTQCKTSCATGVDCATSAWCNGTSCEPKKANGESCGAATECTSGYCVNGSCCNVASCTGGLTCETGTCKCNGQVCSGSDTCIDWYEDSDGDTFGNPGEKAKGCSSTGPASGSWVKNSSDCWDNNANAKPGQTQYFTQHRGDGSYDYDCDNNVTKQTPYVVAALACGVCSPKVGAVCPGVFYCGFGCNGTCGADGPTEGFTTDVACGNAGTKVFCPAYNGSCAAKVTGGGATQACR